MRLHERNQKFEWRASEGPYRLLTQVQAHQYDEQGYFLLENAFAQDEIRAVTEAIDPIEQAYEQQLREQFNGKLFIAKADAITFTINLVLRSQVLKDFSRTAFFATSAMTRLVPGRAFIGSRQFIKSPAIPKNSPGIRTMATPLPSRSNISPVGCR